ncbi:succinylglutamate desuccinylase [Rhodothalassium salexigens]|uniref:succinylglutamate desuccinylase/aspartoacylase family protein n=1 Tax=Rhodothalassium salexigens TaxID=1086 RepID=UPI00191334F4|nr:succinylglutamate desuccinylase/aspartoacylase family protein [Rhodothalassium salexigens]MBK5912667.1 succinylglutamate desuccinylase [Rhodothalassium salexigens]MBK5920800.1 succinylglutamate desuccinylase [Rhodothalassium salexigens]
MPDRQAPFEIAGETVPAGTRRALTLDLPGQSAYTPLSMPIYVVHGRTAGPTLFLSAAIHGDEITGIDVIRRVLRTKALARMRGTLICAPIVNVFGYSNHTRYLPDRRDLNRSFPGSATGSLAARVAHVFITEVVRRASHGIDLHSGANNRTNLPHIRADLDDPETERLARAFGTPIAINANLRDGSLRHAARDLGVPILLYEAGEALRFDPLASRAGVRGVLGVMRALAMLPPEKKRKTPEVIEAVASAWVRAPCSGLLHSSVALGARVEKGGALGLVGDAFGEADATVTSPYTGIVVGRTNLPVVNEGDALYHIARFNDSAGVESALETWQQDHIEGLTLADYVEPDLN